MSALDGTWTLYSVDGKPVSADDRVPFFSLHGTSFNGFDGCNRFGGDLRQPHSTVVGQRACAGTVVRIPLDPIRLSDHLDNAELEGNRLRLTPREGYPASEFRRGKSRP
ncbi:MAG: META domain-containing protein [Hyphomicrobiales bacterium]|nr:META domain-containing protein [Nitratireductor sp.]MCC2097263.1 META domain-containing protein [Hyphomicrobiales bacterium]